MPVNQPSIATKLAATKQIVKSRCLRLVPLALGPSRGIHSNFSAPFRPSVLSGAIGASAAIALAAVEGGNFSHIPPFA